MYNFIYVLLAGASAEEIVCEGYKKICPMWLKVYGRGGQVSKKCHCVTLFSPWISLCH